MLTQCIFHTNTLESRSALFDVGIRDYIHMAQVDSRDREGTHIYELCALHYLIMRGLIICTFTIQHKHIKVDIYLSFTMASRDIF